ncbi:hypothetical protein RB213_003182 [Colletotrichum asianum]
MSRRRQPSRRVAELLCIQKNWGIRRISKALAKQYQPRQWRENMVWPLYRISQLMPLSRFRNLMSRMKRRQVLVKLVKLEHTTPVDGYDVHYKLTKKRKSPTPQVIIQIVECACKCQPDSAGACPNPECKSNRGCGSTETSQSSLEDVSCEDATLSEDCSSAEEDEIIDAGHDMHVTLGDLQGFIEAVTGPNRTSLSQTYEFDAYLRCKETALGNPFGFDRHRQIYHSEQMVHGSSVIPKYELNHNQEPVIIDFNDGTNSTDSPKPRSTQPPVAADQDLTPEQLARRLRNRQKKLKKRNRGRQQTDLDARNVNAGEVVLITT